VIYLFSQIAISLVLAAIVGGALGWIIHRALAAKHTQQLQSIIARQQQQVSEAQTEVNILTADFDDLKQASESEISALKKENQQIPTLNQNLEKSQLLVRQMMEKHKTEIDETSDEHEKLLAQSRHLYDRENEISKLRAELEIERRKSAQPDPNIIEAENANSGFHDTGNRSANLHTKSASPVDDPHTSRTSSAKPGTDHGSVKSASEISQSTAATPDPIKLPLSANSVSSNSHDKIDESNDDTLPNTAQTEAELAEIRDQLAHDASTNPHDQASTGSFVEVSPSLAKPQHLDDTDVDDTELEQMFDSVEQHDDLKQIFGIGPVTEKTLNKLGITAYSQLAELKQHDIEKIANALQIFPGRIERDNWVGSARAQLEEVLEDL